MLVIGLTGGIGSGKSTVANLFVERGVPVIDTDQLSRDVTQPGQPALEKIAEKWGLDILQADGTLNRAILRKIIFKKEEDRRWLEQLLHPLIRTEMEKQIKNAKGPYCIVVIPLLLEGKPNPLINRILVVDATEDLQKQRTQARDRVRPEEVDSIIKSQIDREKRLAAADDIIQNHGSLKDLEIQVDKLHNLYCSVASS